MGGYVQESSHLLQTANWVLTVALLYVPSEHSLKVIFVHQSYVKVAF